MKKILNFEDIADSTNVTEFNTEFIDEFSEYMKESINKSKDFASKAELSAKTIYIK